MPSHFEHLKNILRAFFVSALAIAMVVGIVLLSSKNSKRDNDIYTSPNYFLMDTTLQILIREKNDEKAKEHVAAALKRVKKIEAETSRFKKESEVSKINRNAGSMPVKVSKDTFDIIKQSIQYSEITGGAFDITVAPISKLWGFYSKKYRIPSPQEIEEARKLVGYRNIILDEQNQAVILPQKGQEIDLGAMAKGYATREMCKVLEQRGVRNALVNFGGTVGAIGKRSKEKEWLIGIKNPRGSLNDFVGEMTLKDSFVSTSGDYERFFEKGGKRYCHIFDPRTGYQPSHTIATTVVGPDGAIADILSTTIFVQGAKEGLATVATLGGYEALIIDSKGEVLMTEGFKKYLKEIREHI